MDRRGYREQREVKIVYCYGHVGAHIGEGSPLLEIWSEGSPICTLLYGGGPPLVVRRMLLEVGPPIPALASLVFLAVVERTGPFEDSSHFQQRSRSRAASEERERHGASVSPGQPTAEPEALGLQLDDWLFERVLLSLASWDEASRTLTLQVLPGRIVPSLLLRRGGYSAQIFTRMLAAQGLAPVPRGKAVLGPR